MKSVIATMMTLVLVTLPSGPSAGQSPQKPADNASQQASDPFLLPLDSLRTADFLSSQANVPLSVTLADVITKSSTIRFESGLGSPGILSPISAGKTTASEFTGDSLAGSARTGAMPREWFASAETPYAANAASKGYLPRVVDLDPRYRQNLDRIALQSKGTGRLMSLGQSRPDKPAFQASIADYFGRNAELSGTTPTPSASMTERIWFGTQIEQPDPFSETVAILGNGRICSGVLVRDDLVLTAAHCFCGGVAQEVRFGVNILFPTATVAVDLSASDSLRPCDSLKGNLGSGDIALLKLRQAVEDVQPGRVSTLKAVRDAASIRAVGFGRTPGGGAGVKFQVNVIIASYQCDGVTPLGLSDQHVYRCKPSHELVAAGLNRDTCAGDSGGPAFVLGPDNKLYVAAVTSRAVDESGKCGPGGIYVLTATDEIRSWLASKGVPTAQ
jgi:hypothetical protein